MSTSSSLEPQEQSPDPKFRAFYLGPRGTYSHSVARAVFHAARPSAPPTPGALGFSASHFDGQSSSSIRTGESNGAAEVQLVPCTTITKTLEAALQEAQHGSGAHSSKVECAYAVLPIENSTFGPVQETLDVLKRAGISIGTGSSSASPEDEEKKTILGEYRLAVTHTLLAGPRTKQRLRQLSKQKVIPDDGTRQGTSSAVGTATDSVPSDRQLQVGDNHLITLSVGDEDDLNVEDLAPLSEVLSHEQALGQCANFLKTYAPQAKPISFASTALAAEQALQHDYRPSTGDDESALAGGLVAAVGSELCSEVYGLSVLRRHVEDRSDNTTRFIVIQVEIASEQDADASRPDLSGVLRPFAGVPLYSKPTL